MERFREFRGNERNVGNKCGSNQKERRILWKIEELKKKKKFETRKNSKNVEE
jgi:hypothetical protein